MSSDTKAQFAVGRPDGGTYGAENRKSSKRRLPVAWSDVTTGLEIPAEPNVEEIRIVDLSARGAFEFTIGKRVVA